MSELGQYQLKPDINGNLYFYGSSVAVSGNFMAVGATGQSGSGPNQGAVFVFTKPATATWGHARVLGVLTASDGAAEDEFGSQIAMTANTIVVSAPLHAVGAGPSAHLKQGAAYVFTKPAGGWTSATENAELAASDGAAGDELKSVAVSGNTVVLGSALINAQGHAGQGEAYVFTKPATGWASSSAGLNLQDPNHTAGDGFGAAVAVSGDSVYVGAPGAAVTTDPVGAVWTYTDPSQKWTSAPTPGVLTASNGESGDELGAALAVSRSTVVAAAPSRTIGQNVGQGAVYVYTEPSHGWGLHQHQQAMLTQSDGQNQDGFGVAVAVNGDTIVAGAHQHSVGSSSSQGAAYDFTKPAHGWADRSEKANLLATDGNADSDFGDAVAVSNRAILVGSDTHQKKLYYGSAYAFGLPLPALTKVTQTKHQWRAGKHTAVVNPRHHLAGGTVFSGVVNEPATLRIHLFKLVGSKGVSKGVIKAAAKKGKIRVYFDGVISKGHVLAPGHYYAAIDATNFAGFAQTKVLKFTVLSAHKKHEAH